MHFYLYTENELPLFHANLRDCVKASHYSPQADQHAGSFFLHSQLLEHPARTLSPHKARLFVVPFWMEVSHGVGDCHGTTHLQRVLALVRALRAAAPFQRAASNHLLFVSSWRLREPPSATTRHAQHWPGRCYSGWPGYGTSRLEHFWPKDEVAEATLSAMLVGHMERFSAGLCDAVLPGSNMSLFPHWAPTWWGGRNRTLVLPYVVDSATMRRVRERREAAGGAGAVGSRGRLRMDDYASWLARPLTVYFAGGFVKSGAGAFVRLGLSSLNVPGRGAAGDVRVHCAGRSKAAAASTTPWLAAARSGVAGVAPPAYVHGMQWEGYFDAYLADLHRLHWRPMARDTAHGRHCLPPLTAEEDVRNMEQAKFCLCPRGDSPSSSRIYAAIALGCIPIIVSDQWYAMASPFGGRLSYERFALSLPEVEAISTPRESMRALLEATGGRPPDDGGSGGGWRFPEAGSAAAEPLKQRLRAMQAAHSGGLWQLTDPSLRMANLTLAAAFDLLRAP